MKPHDDPPRGRGAWLGLKVTVAAFPFLVLGISALRGKGQPGPSHTRRVMVRDADDRMVAILFVEGRRITSVGFTDASGRRLWSVSPPDEGEDRWVTVLPAGWSTFRIEEDPAAPRMPGSR